MGIYDSSERHANPYVIYSNIRYGKQVAKNILLNIKLPRFLWSALTDLLLIAPIHRLYVFVGSCLSLPVTHEKHCRFFAPNVNRSCMPGCCLSVPSAKIHVKEIELTLFLSLNKHTLHHIYDAIEVGKTNSIMSLF